MSPRGGNMKKYGCATRHTMFGNKNTVYACLLISEGGDSFRRLLDLALAPNKTNEWGSEAMEHPVMCSIVTYCHLIGGVWTGSSIALMKRYVDSSAKRGYMRVLTVA